MSFGATVAVAGIVILAALLLLRWKMRRGRYMGRLFKYILLNTRQTPLLEPVPVQLVHKLPVGDPGLEEKDSLDGLLDALTQKLADKEIRVRLSKSKLRATQNEVAILQPIDKDVRNKYREIMDTLRRDLCKNETECKRLQEQIETVSRKRAELHDELTFGQTMYSKAATELVNNLTELQRGRLASENKFTHDQTLFEKPTRNQSWSSLRRRSAITKEPLLPRSTPMGSVIIKSPPPSSPTRGRSQSIYYGQPEM